VATKESSCEQSQPSGQSTENLVVTVYCWSTGNYKDYSMVIIYLR
jgi:hypothetical protein